MKPSWARVRIRSRSRVGWKGKSQAGQRFDRGEPPHAKRGLDPAILPQGQFLGEAPCPQADRRGSDVRTRSARPSARSGSRSGRSAEGRYGRIGPAPTGDGRRRDCAAVTAAAGGHPLGLVRLRRQRTSLADPRRSFLRRPPGRATSARAIAGRRIIRILRGLARLAYKRFQFFDPTRQRLDQRRLQTDDPILVGFAQKSEWGTIHPKIDSETQPLRKPIFANHVSSYIRATQTVVLHPPNWTTRPFFAITVLADNRDRQQSRRHYNVLK
jgi:hypothetical protein